MKKTPSSFRFILPGIIIAGVIAILYLANRSGDGARDVGGAPNIPLPPDQQALIDQVIALEEERKQVENTVWRREAEAKYYGLYFIHLWNGLKDAPEPLSELNRFPANEIRYGEPNALPSVDATKRFSLAGGQQAFGHEDWLRRIQTWRDMGWRLEQSEWRHVGFTPAGENSDSPQSQVAMTAHLSNSHDRRRLVLRGRLYVLWPSRPDPSAPFPVPDRIDASGIEVLASSEPPAFERKFFKQIAPFAKTFFIDPLIARDLNGDGLSEIVLAARNLLFENRGDFQFEERPLCLESPGLIFTGMIADFDDAPGVDYLCLDRKGLLLVSGSGAVPFEKPAVRVWEAPEQIQYGQSLTAGDVDGDRDLDVWVGQYKLPFDKGQMPSPYYDANDGHPSYLLRNEGEAGFVDATLESGLEGKRHRRIYSSSFVDADADGDLDLLAVSDFSGVDAFRNRGDGTFEDATADWFQERHSFGMAHLFGDFNRDARLDFFMIGMNSPTAERLDSMRLGDPAFPGHTAFRSKMTHGNRFYFGKGDRFETAPFQQDLARTGWSWGTTSFDFDNDGDSDVYIANGHESDASVEDYERQFWLHDIYLGDSENDRMLDLYFNFMSTQLRGAGLSYGGYELNRFFVNRDNRGFFESAYLHGVSFQDDSRNVVSDDLNGDGKVDLIVTTWHVWPEMKQTLRVFANRHANENHWIAFAPAAGAADVDLIGMKATIRTETGTQSRWIATGDSYRSQHSMRLHFGLGSVARVDEARFEWPNGREPLVLKDLLAGKVYFIEPAIE